MLFAPTLPGGVAVGASYPCPRLSREPRPHRPDGEPGHQVPVGTRNGVLRPARLEQGAGFAQPFLR